MANLDIVKELQQERDRLDAAINALTSLGGQNAHYWAHDVRRSPQADCCRTTSPLGKTEGSKDCSDQSKQTSHLATRASQHQSGAKKRLGEGQGG